MKSFTWPVFETSPVKSEPTNVCVVRVITTAWRTDYGIHQKKSLMFMRRKSKGLNILEEDASSTEDAHVMRRITNLNSVDDGLYTVAICDEERDFETGYVEDWNYKLVPFVEE